MTVEIYTESTAGKIARVYELNKPRDNAELESDERNHIGAVALSADVLIQTNGLIQGTLQALHMFSNP